MRRLGVLTGLAAERRIIERAARGAVPATACAGADSARAAREAAALIAAGAEALLSFGLAAGLDREVRPGTVVCAAHIVLTGGETTATQVDWREAVIAAATAAGIPVLQGKIAATDRVLRNAAEKRALREQTGALAADMESGPLAATAAAAGVPHLSVRAVADPAERALPAWARSAVRGDGRIAARDIAARLALRPWEMPALALLTRDSLAGFAALRGVAALDAALLEVP